MVKAIFFDIDGTLVSFKTHQIPPKTKEALKKLKENNIKIFIATGRGKDGLAILKDIEFDGYITLNGQYCFTKDKLIYENTIVKDDLEKLLDYLEKNPNPCGFTSEDTKIFNMRDKRVDIINEITNNDNHPVGDCSQIVNQKIYQCMCFIDEDQEKELMKHLTNCTSARWHPLFCDISPLGGTKQKGIDEFLKYYNIDLDDCMAFGDGGNDLQMLQHVPISVAMGNGVDKLKKVATYVTSDVDNDGVYEALKYFNCI